MKTLTYLFLSGALLVALAGASRLDQPSSLKVLVPLNERVSDSEAHLRLSMTNSSDRPIFLTGVIYESESHVIPAYLEQEQISGEWRTVLPCMDTAPPQIIKLDPARQIEERIVLKIPLEGVCKERNIRFEGRFRFRLNYFRSEEQARTYLKTFFSKDAEQVGAAVAVSEAFRIPPFNSQPK